jgi:hypothetical protein
MRGVSLNCDGLSIFAETVRRSGTSKQRVASVRRQRSIKSGLHAVNLKTGRARWVVPTGELPGFVTGGVMSTPLVVNGKESLGRWTID